MRPALTAAALAVLCVVPSWGEAPARAEFFPDGLSAATPEPAFVAGYAASVLDQFGLSGATVTVAGSRVIVEARGLRLTEKEGIARSLLRAGATEARFPPDTDPYPRNRYAKDQWARFDSQASSDAFKAKVPPLGRTAFPRRLLFDPLLADPRWPSFSARQIRYRAGAGVKRVWAANFGESFPVLGGDIKDGLWQIGLQGAVFTQWNLDTVSDDQISADFVVGLPVSWRWDRFSAMARLYHVSTHLGDEFILTHPGLARVNLSYEALDLRLSYDVGDSWRVYGGGGRMIRRDPKDTPPGEAQLGLEYSHPRAYWKGRFRPVAAVDLQKHQKSGWGATAMSLRMGAQIEHRATAARRLLLMFEYYKGRDPNGQFFTRDVEYSGFGVHLYF